jgi:hypothetical protein
MTSPRKVFTNRLNALRSTGPRTPEGKARVGKNALRHGLSVLALRDPSRAGEIATLARAIAGDDPTAWRLALAAWIAAAQIDVVRARGARLGSYPQTPDEPGAIARLAAIDRYEKRAMSRRNRAVMEVRIMELDHRERDHEP